MKRLVPFDSTSSVSRDSFDDAGTGSDSSSGAGESHHSDPHSRRCALPAQPDRRRTAFLAFISSAADGVITVREAPIEIAPFRDTDLVHFAYRSSAEDTEEIRVTVTAETCFDVVRPYQLLEQNTAVIVVGLGLGTTVQAEIIADMEFEASYRSLLMQHQPSRRWYKRHDSQPRSGSV